MDLKTVLPPFYDDNKTMIELQDILSGYADDGEAALQKVVDESFVNTAEKTLNRMEEILGLPYQAETEVQYRRERIRAKLLGQGTTTVALVKNIAEQFTNGTVDVTEENEQYNVIITFTGTIGIPPALASLKTALREIIPAHLAINYVIIYNTYQDLEPYTYEHLEQYTYQECFDKKIQ